MSDFFNDGEREQVKAKIALMGASGAGKTVSALKLAYGITGDWKKIAVADTENKRALAYIGTSHTGLDIGSFKHRPMHAPYKTEHFAEVLNQAVKAGMEVLIYDSFSHEWEGLGGVTHAAEEAGGAFWDWKGPKIAHRRLVDDIQQAPIHVIVTIRTKQEYAVSYNEVSKKNEIQKLGMKPVQSNDIDYEFLLAFHANEEHNVRATKDNTGLFGGEEFRIEAEHGEKLRAWLVEGKEVKTISQERQEQEEAHQKLINYFAEARLRSDKAQTWFTQKEISAGKDLDQWDYASLKKLYDMVNKPKQEAPPQQEQEAPQQEEEKPKANKAREAKIIKINEMIVHPEVKAKYDEYLGKMKCEVDDLKPKDLKMLLEILEIRTKSIEKGA